jgi:hypothetical protein
VPRALLFSLRPSIALPPGAGSLQLTGAWRRIRPFLGYAGAIAPITLVAVILWLIWTRTPIVPWWDEWATVGLLERADHGTLTPSDFWQPFYYSHRIVLPRMVNLALIEATGWNRQIQMTIDYAIAIAAVAMILSCVRSTTGSTKTLLALLAPLSLLLLSWSQYGNWFLPFQIAFIGTFFGAALCLWALATASMDRRRFALAAMGALIATLSSSAGLTVWLAFIPCLARWGRRPLLTWCCMTIVVWVAYLYDFPAHSSLPSLALGWAFMLTFLGAPIGYPSALLSMLIGLVGLPLMGAALYLYWRRRGELLSVLPWICLALYALANAALTALGRASSGAADAVVSRYQFLPALWWVAFFVITAQLVRDLLRRGPPSPTSERRQITPNTLAATVMIALLIVLSSGLLVVNAIGLRDGIAWQDDLRAHQWCIAHYDHAPDACLGIFFPITDKQINLSYAAYLKQRQLGIFARK